MSLGLAMEMANEWEHRVREYKKSHRRAVTSSLELMIEWDIRKEDTPSAGLWDRRDVAKKACEILAERVGEKYIYRKLQVR